MYDLPARPNEYIKAYLGAPCVPAEPGCYGAGLCSSPAGGVGESNLSCSRAASSRRALIRRPPGLPASVWSGGLSSPFLIPSRGEKKRFDYLLTNNVGAEVAFGSGLVESGGGLDWRIYWTAHISCGDLSGRLITSAVGFLSSFYSLPSSTIVFIRGKTSEVL